MAEHQPRDDETLDLLIKALDADKPEIEGAIQRAQAAGNQAPSSGEG